MLQKLRQSLSRKRSVSASGYAVGSDSDSCTLPDVGGVDHSRRFNSTRQSSPRPLPSRTPSPQPSRASSVHESVGPGADSASYYSDTDSAWRPASEGIQRFTLLHELGRCRKASTHAIVFTAPSSCCMTHALRYQLCYRGSSGAVFMALETASGRQVAIKRIPLRPRFRADAVLRELENQQLCRGHPHIIQLQVSCTPTRAPASIWCVLLTQHQRHGVHGRRHRKSF